LVGEGEQCLTGGSEGELAAGAVKESGAEFGFESFDLLGDGGLREEEFFGGDAEVEVSRGGPEDLEAEVFHGECDSTGSVAKRVVLGFVEGVW